MLIFTQRNYKPNKKKLEIMEIVCLAIGLGVGALITQSMKPKCNHKWELIESGNVVNGGNKVYARYKFYECEHCLKMKNEQVGVN